MNERLLWKALPQTKTRQSSLQPQIWLPPIWIYLWSGEVAPAKIRKVRKSICEDYLTLFVPRIPVNPIYPISSLCDADAVKMILSFVGFVGFNNNFWFPCFFSSLLRCEAHKKLPTRSMGSESKQFKKKLGKPEPRLRFTLSEPRNRMENGMSSTFWWNYGSQLIR